MCVDRTVRNALRTRPLLESCAPLCSDVRAQVSCSKRLQRDRDAYVGSAAPDGIVCSDQDPLLTYGRAIQTKLRRSTQLVRAKSLDSFTVRLEGDRTLLVLGSATSRAVARIYVASAPPIGTCESNTTIPRWRRPAAGRCVANAVLLGTKSIELAVSIGRKIDRRYPRRPSLPVVAIVM